MTSLDLRQSLLRKSKSDRHLRGLWCGSISRRILLPAFVAVVVVCAWEFGSRLGFFSPAILVSPSAVWEAARQALPILIRESVPTIEETLLGFFLAALLGLILGIALAQSQRIRQAVFPHLLLFQLIPKVALAPLFIIWLGVGSCSRLSFAVFMGFFPVVITTMTGLMSTDRNVMRLCRALRANRRQIFFAVQIPYALPHIFSGLKISITMAIVGVVVGEFVTAQEGLGYMVMYASSSEDTALMLAAILLLCAIGLLFYGAIYFVEWLVERCFGVTLASNEF